MILQVGSPPRLGKSRGGHVGYKDYEPWLLRVFYLELCAYCLTHDPNTHVDHVVPQQLAGVKADEPTNLLPACSSCNRQKSDYHPRHTTRRRLPHDKTKHLVLDVRVDDFADLYDLDPDGGIRAKAGPSSRANWNITLLALDLKAGERKTVFRLLEMAERAVHALGGRDVKVAELAKSVLKPLLPELASRALFLDVYGIPVSRKLGKMLAERRLASLPSAEVD